MSDTTTLQQATFVIRDGASSTRAIRLTLVLVAILAQLLSISAVSLASDTDLHAAEPILALEVHTEPNESDEQSLGAAYALSGNWYQLRASGTSAVVGDLRLIEDEPDPD